MQPWSNAQGIDLLSRMMGVELSPVAPSTRGETGYHDALLKHSSRFESGRVDHSCFARVVQRKEHKPPKLEMAVQVCPCAPKFE